MKNQITRVVENTGTHKKKNKKYITFLFSYDMTVKMRFIRIKKQPKMFSFAVIFMSEVVVI